MTNSMLNFEFPHSIELLEHMASESIEKGPFTYVNSGSGAESTLRANVIAFEDWHIASSIE